MKQVSLQEKHKVDTQIKRFMIAGFSAVTMDTLVYFLLVQLYSPSLSKVLSFLCGTLVAYLLNKFWTFKKNSHSLSEVLKFIILYTSTLVVNVSVNALCLIYISSAKPIAFVIATGASTILNFTGQKWWVFKK
ncbi:GtrA family protein [Jeotgalibacillus marinus]|uniref:GtrA family protein n=1 Tax=Jeotgalibacillus marinus TaxID=86667 RepID=A0ABV3Q1E9_9BACL